MHILLRRCREYCSFVLSFCFFFHLLRPFLSEWWRCIVLYIDIILFRRLPSLLVFVSCPFLGTFSLLHLSPPFLSEFLLITSCHLQPEGSRDGLH